MAATGAGIHTHTSSGVCAGDPRAEKVLLTLSDPETSPLDFLSCAKEHLTEDMIVS